MCPVVQIFVIELRWRKEDFFLLFICLEIGLWTKYLEEYIFRYFSLNLFCWNSLIKYSNISGYIAFNSGLHFQRTSQTANIELLYIFFLFLNWNKLPSSLKMILFVGPILWMKVQLFMLSQSFWKKIRHTVIKFKKYNSYAHYKYIKYRSPKLFQK